MSWIQACVLGALQGITEFLPVSSSGHLRIGEWMFSKTIPTNDFFEIYLHGITLLVVLWVFRKNLILLIKNRPLLVAIVLSTIPTLLLIKGLHLDTVYPLLEVKDVLVLEIVTGLCLILGEKFARRDKSESFPLWQAALLIGVAQGFAALPGLSRSGLTIAAAMMLGWKRDKAFDFAFLMSIPVIGAAMLLKTVDAYQSPTLVIPGVMVLIAGALPAAVLGYLTLIGLRQWVQRSLMPFAAYTLILGTVGLLVI